MPKDVSRGFAQVLPEAARERLTRLIEDHQDKGIDLLKTSAVKTRELSLKSRSQRIEAKVMVQEMQRGERNADSIVAKFVADDLPLEVAFVLSEICDVDEGVVNNALMKVDGTPTAVLSRVAGLSMLTFEAITEMRAKRLQLPESHVAHLKKQYAELDDDNARKTLRFLKIRQAV